MAIKDAVRPELYIKIAIVILGGFFAVTAAGKLNLASSLLLRGVAAIVEAYLIYWAVVYFIARKWFGFSREWSAPLGVRHLDLRRLGGDRHRRRHSRAPGRAGAGLVAGRGVRRHRSADPALRGADLALHEPLVAGAWMGLAVKTDGAAVAAGGITESLILAKNAAEGIHYQPGWILGTAATIKVFIDIFIGIWAFVLGYIWTNHINVTPTATRPRLGKSGSAFPNSSSASW